MAALDRLVARVDTLVPPEATSRPCAGSATRPRWPCPPGDGPLDLTDHETWLVRQICTDYLPRAIEHYLALPPDLASSPCSTGGPRARCSTSSWR